MVPIVQKEDPVLRAVAEAVDFDTLKPAELHKIIQRMKSALDSQDDGVAIAAPQIGVSLRIFIVSKRVFEIIQNKKSKKTLEKEQRQEDAKEALDAGVGAKEKQKNNRTQKDDLVFINPRITKMSKEKKMMEEGCLSVRWLYGEVYRSTRATVEAYDEQGNVFHVGASGLLAQIFQHETDHLNGILFTDTAENVEEVLPEDQKANEEIDEEEK